MDADGTVPASQPTEASESTVDAPVAGRRVTIRDAPDHRIVTPPVPPAPPAVDDPAHSDVAGVGEDGDPASSREVVWRDVTPPRRSVAAELPGIARVAANGMLRAAGWTVNTSAHAGGRMVRAAIAGRTPTEVVQEGRADLLSAAREALGLYSPMPAAVNPPRHNRAELQARGAALLYRSADVGFDDEIHPAYAEILDQLAADEARILRVLAVEGPQPAIDVRTWRPFGVGSTRVAQGLSMLGDLAGCRHLDRTPSYLNNLNRLGLLWFSKELVEPGRYQVVEVQPAVTEAIARAGRSARTVRRSIELTPFGRDFCRVCLPLEGAE